MCKLEVYKIALWWVLMQIVISVILSAILCPTIRAHFYQVFLFPLYFIIALIILYVVKVFYVYNNIIYVLVFLILVFFVGIWSRDFRSIFNIGQLNPFVWNLDNLIATGCRELFTASSLILSSLTIISLIIAKKVGFK
jgi:hypothetical protein